MKMKPSCRKPVSVFVIVVEVEVAVEAEVDFDSITPVELFPKLTWLILPNVLAHFLTFFYEKGRDFYCFHLFF